MNTLKQLIVLFVFSFLSFQAKAGIEIEPYVGVYALKSTASANVTTKNPLTSTTTTKDVDSSGSYGGSAYGLKLGWNILLVTVGGDFMLINHGKMTTTNIGPAVSVGLGLATLKATYFVSSQSKEDTLTSKGTGLKAGIGFSVFPFVEVNLEYLSMKHDKITDSSGSDLITYNTYESTDSGGMLSISLVF